MSLRAFLCVAVLLVGCAAPAVATFAPGIHYRAPGSPGHLATVGGVASSVALPVGGFALASHLLVVPHEGNALRLVSPDGGERVVTTTLGHVARPSLAPDGARVVVQATSGEDPRSPPANIDVFVVDLATGAATRVAGAAHNEESPEWLPDGRIAYSSFSPVEGVDLHVVDADGRETLAVDEAGAIHLAASDDGERILDPGRLRLYDAEDGGTVADLHAKAVAALQAAGFALDTRFPGQAGRGTFPLDGDLSPDGRWIVADGAVVRDGVAGVLLFRIGIDGEGFEVLAGPFDVDPGETNGNNYSQLNPVWL